MKYCPNCGAAVNDSAAFCPQCGTTVSSPSKQEPAYNYSQPVMGDAPAAPGYNPGDGYGYNPGNGYRNNDPYSSNNYSGNAGTAIKLSTSRGLLKFILLSLITFGIYGIVAMSKVSTDINIIASRYDGRKTMHYCLVTFVFSWLTLGIYPLIWMHNLCDRIGNELRRRGIFYSFGPSTFWLWGILGSLIVVGPFIYGHKLFKAMNLLSADYNQRG